MLGFFLQQAFGERSIRILLIVHVRIFIDLSCTHITHTSIMHPTFLDCQLTIVSFGL